MTDEPNSQPIADGQTGLVDAPPRAAFVEAGLPGEPQGDRKLLLYDGMAIRERFTMADARSDGVKTDAKDPAAVAFTIAISSALLDENDQVVTHDGKPVISQAHEIVLTNEALGRLGSDEAVEAAILEAREIAAARAALEFRGAMLAENLLSSRLRPNPSL